MTLESSIINTLTYSDHFSFPLTKVEIYDRLIHSRVKNKKHLETVLNQLVDRGTVEASNGFYFLPGRKSLVDLRKNRFKNSIGDLSRAQLYAKKIARINGVLAVYLTGSLAMSNSGSGSDIDYMIITKNGRLWLTRLFLTLYFELSGLRRKPNSQFFSGKICLNLYLTPDSLELPNEKRSLYTAYELIQAKPLHDPHDTQALLMKANSWLLSYLPNIKISKTNNLENNEQVTRLTKLLETFAYNFQLFYMRKKLTRELITRNSAFFHPKDPGSKVLKKISL